MTFTSNIQMIGIDDATFNAASEEQRVVWGRQNTTCWDGLCDAARDWLDNISAYVGVLTEEGKLRGCGCVRLDDPGLTYRLAPDYQPPVKRWWFSPLTNSVNYSMSDEFGKQGYIEVTAEYADYLRNKPEGEWELRKVKKGDVFNMVGFRGMDTVAHRDFTTSESNIEDRGYRWCKPRKVAGWVEYEVFVMDGEYVICYNGGHRLQLYKAANRVGFGGVQFDGQEDKAQWFTGTNAGIYPDGQIAKYSFNDCDDDAAPAVPVRARFWEVPK